jgi:hypothetical protein
MSQVDLNEKAGLLMAHPALIQTPIKLLLLIEIR